MFEGILFCLLGGASVTAQFMLQLYVNRLLSKDPSFLFSRAQYALFTEFKDLGTHCFFFPVETLNCS